MASRKLAQNNNNKKKIYVCTYAPVLTNRCQNMEAIGMKSHWYESGSKKQIGQTVPYDTFPELIKMCIFYLLRLRMSKLIKNNKNVNKASTCRFKK